MLNSILNIILTTYFSNSRCVNYISDNANVFISFYKIPVLVLNASKYEILFHGCGCKNFVLNTNQPYVIFDHIEREMSLHSDRFNSRKYVVIAKSGTDLLAFSNTQYITYVSDLIILIANDTIRSRKIDIWTHIYTGLAGNNEFYFLDTWFFSNKSFLFNNNLFPQKLKNQKLRPLKCAVFPYEPYVIIGEYNY